MARPDTELAVKTAMGDRLILEHKVVWGATGAVSSESTNSGVAFTRSATGRYSVVIDAPAQNAWLMGSCHDGSGSAADVNWHVYTSFVAATRTIVLSNSPGGSETDPTSGDETTFFFWVAPGDTGFDADD